MPLTFRSNPTGYQESSYANLIPTPITSVTAASTVAGQITLSWTGGAGNNVKYSYALSTGTIQSVSGVNPTTITLTSNTSISTIVTVTATVLDGSTNAVSNSVTTAAPNSFNTFSTISASTFSRVITGLSSTTYGQDRVCPAVNIAQTKMLYGTAQGVWYATSTDAGATWTFNTTALQSQTPPGGNQGGSVALSGDGTRGLYYCNGNFLYYINWSGATPTISTISSSVTFNWGSISMISDGSIAVFGGNGTSGYYTTWNPSTLTYNTPGTFAFTVPHMAFAISQDKTTLIADDASSSTYIGYISISSWSTGNSPTPTLVTTTWQSLGTGTNINLNGGALCFLGGNSSSPSTYVVGVGIGGPIYLYTWNSTNKTLTYVNQPIGATGLWQFGIQASGTSGNTLYFVENTSTGTPGTNFNISRVTFTIA